LSVPRRTHAPAWRGICIGCRAAAAIVPALSSVEQRGGETGVKTSKRAQPRPFLALHL
jgi:hypothetical protein